MKARVGQLCLLFYPQINLQNSSRFLVSVLLQMTFLTWAAVWCLLTLDVLLVIGVWSMNMGALAVCVG